MAGANYRDLIVWQRAVDFSCAIYAATKSFPKEEIYGLTSQMRRAGVSIASNIAEGQGRRSKADFQRYLNIAYGSLREVETHITISQKLAYLGAPIATGLLNSAAEIGRLINGLSESLSRPVR